VASCAKRSRGQDGERNEENNSFFASTGQSKRIRAAGECLRTTVAGALSVQAR
jgi:hypothetical protein